MTGQIGKDSPYSNENTVGLPFKKGRFELLEKDSELLWYLAKSMFLNRCLKMKLESFKNDVTGGGGRGVPQNGD